MWFIIEPDLGNFDSTNQTYIFSKVNVSWNNASMYTFVIKSVTLSKVLRDAS